MLKAIRNEKGVTLVEVLVALLLVIVASISALSFFSYGFGNIGKQGNRRAALEQGRARLEQLLASNVSDVTPSDQSMYWLTCSGNPCAWTFNGAETEEQVTVNDMPSQRMVTTVQLIDDAASGTTTPDALEFSVRVWYTQNFTDDTDFNRIHLRALRTP